VPAGGWRVGERGEVVIQYRQRPAGRGLPGSGDELEAQPVEQHPQARRLVLGKTRRVPVGNGRKGEEFWIIAEHGTRAGYVRNIQHDPHVRVRLRTGLRYRWVPGIATICPDDDPLARQRRIIAWHPLRALNAINVRVLGADLLTVHVQLNTAQAGDPGRAAGTTAAAQPVTATASPS
jgi:hypothetical protein